LKYRYLVPNDVTILVRFPLLTIGINVHSRLFLMSSSGSRYAWSTHRILDSIHLLKVRIILQHDRQAQRGAQEDDPPAGAIPEEVSGDEHSSDSAPKSRQQSESFDRLIAWQERLYSHTEVKNCRAGVAHETEAEKRMADRIVALLEEDPNYNGDVIFTQVDDDFVDPSEIDRPFGKVGERPETDLAAAVLKGEGAQDLVDIVHHSSAKSMHFYASLLSNNGTYHEELLGIIRFFPGGRLDVRPRFSNKTNPVTTYKFFTPSNELISYTFDVCEDRIEEQSTFERTLIGDIKRRRAILDAAPSNCALANVPSPPDSIRMFYRGEIATAKMFHHESVAIDYVIKFPQGWDREDPDDSYVGLTQLVSCRREDGVAHINMPIEFTAVCRSQLSPTIEVCLHTYTESHARVVIGYGTCALPMQRGSHEITFGTWRVRGTVMDELRLQFLDSGLEIQPSVELGGSALGDGPSIAINRFGLRTTGTGTVTIKMNLVQQSDMFKKKDSGAQPMTALGSIARDPSRLSSLYTRSQTVV
jgi:Meckel syndrome type 1 protein